MAIGGAILGLVGSASSAVAQQRAGDDAARQAGFESAIQQQQAERERRIAAGDEEGFRIAQARLQGDRQAQLGASGVDPTTGSPVDTGGDLAAEIELQALKIREGGQVRSTRLEQQALLTKKAGENARTRGNARAGASLLSGAAQAFGGGFGGSRTSSPDTSLNVSRGAGNSGR